MRAPPRPASGNGRSVPPSALPAANGTARTQEDEDAWFDDDPDDDLPDWRDVRKLKKMLDLPSEGEGGEGDGKDAGK